MPARPVAGVEVRSRAAPDPFDGPALSGVPRPSRSPDDDGLPAHPRDVLRVGRLTVPPGSWTASLDPRQSAVVRASVDGQLLVSGPAGSGKTLVGLHRALHLARAQPGRVLLTGLAPALLDVLRPHLLALAPELAERIDVVGVHPFALALLRERRVPVALHPFRVAEAFDEAWRTVGRRGLLGYLTPDRSYWEEEIAAVVLGGGLRTVEGYLDSPRSGRLHRLGPDARRALWALHEAYDAALRRRQVHTLPEVVLMAAAELRSCPLAEPYGAVLVDDAHDLSPAMLRMLRLVVPEGPDDVTLLVGTRPALAPGALPLTADGQPPSGRVVTLDGQHRMAGAIADWADGVLAAGDGPVGDPASVGRAGEAPSAQGPETDEPTDDTPAVLVERVDRAAAEAHLVARTRVLVERIGTPAGGIAVLTTTLDAARRAEAALRAAGLPVVPLEQRDGARAEAIVVGTMRWAAGLEFGHVLIPHVAAALLEGFGPSADDVAHEHWALGRIELSSAASRARDGLWLGVV